MPNTEFQLEDFLPYRFNRLAAELSKQTRAAYTWHYDLTTPEWRVLALLAQRDSLTASEIGVGTAMHKTKVSRAVHALGKRRWVTRLTSESDRRVTIISLTSTGRLSFDEIKPSVARFEDEFLAGLEIDKNDLLEILTKTETALSRIRHRLG